MTFFPSPFSPKPCAESAVWQHQRFSGWHSQRFHRWHGRVDVTASCRQHEENIHVRPGCSEEKVHLHPSQVPSGELSAVVCSIPPQQSTLQYTPTTLYPAVYPHNSVPCSIPHRIVPYNIPHNSVPFSIPHNSVCCSIPPQQCTLQYTPQQCTQQYTP